MSETPLPPELQTFNAFVHEVQILLFMARDGELQREAIVKLEAFGPELAEWKKQAVEKGNEDFANVLLGCECVLRFLHAELTMWLLLKEERPEKAWDSLILAQNSILDALRAHDGFSRLQDHSRRLDAIERIVFPPQSFLSAGLLVKSQICSICGEEYGDCPHVKGRPYMGELCRCKLVGVRADHIAFVDVPANKLCRVTHFGDSGTRRNKMTWRLEPNEKPPSDEGLSATGIILTAGDAD